MARTALINQDCNCGDTASDHVLHADSRNPKGSKECHSVPGPKLLIHWQANRTLLKTAVLIHRPNFNLFRAIVKMIKRVRCGYCMRELKNFQKPNNNDIHTPI